MTDSTDTEAPAGGCSAANREIIEMFRDEAGGQLDALEKVLLGTAHGSGDAQLDEAFRAMHSGKGNAGCLGAVDAHDVLGAGENCLVVDIDQLLDGHGTRGPAAWVAA